jgi:23S rRNA pseudouridine955/2504/2580 synthase
MRLQKIPALRTECHILTQDRPQVRYCTVSDKESGQRIDNFLIKQLGGVPKSHVYKLLRSGQVRVNGGRVKAERKLELDDKVRIPPVKVAEKGDTVRPPDEVQNIIRASIIHEDDMYLAINKPAGIAAHGGSGTPYGVIEIVRAWGRFDFIELAHRLDRDTSGVLLLAKTRPGLLRAQRAFKHAGAEKRYFALLVGRWRGEDRDVDDALIRSTVQSGERKVQVDEDGKPAHSRFSPKARYKDATLCEVQIFTGRTHQIRVHAAALGHPVAGDDKYGEHDQVKEFRKRGLKRMFLHSHFLKLLSEGDFTKVMFNAPMPDELRDFLDVLGPGRTGK